jgi:hypothetical protein
VVRVEHESPQRNSPQHVQKHNQHTALSSDSMSL